MLTFLTPYWKQITLYGLLALAVVGLYLKGRSNGVQAERVANIKERIVANKEARRVEHEIRRTSADDKRKRLFNNWKR